MSRERWQELDEKATPEPWLTRNLGRHDQSAIVQDDGQRMLRTGLPVGPAIAGTHGQRGAADAEFIAAARSGWPAAERECEQLRADNAEADAALGQAVTMANDLGREVLDLRALLRQVRHALTTNDWPDNREPDAVALIDQSGLLDDEGQQQPR